MKTQQPRHGAGRQVAAEVGAISASVMLLVFQLIENAIPGGASLPSWSPAALGAIVFLGILAGAVGVSRLRSHEIHLYVALVLPTVCLALQALLQPSRMRGVALSCAQTAVLIVILTGVWLHAGIRRLEADTAALNRLAHQDHLTGLTGRARADEVLEETLVRAHRDGLPVSVALMDLDHFKQYNDTWGHAAGDALLVDAAKVWTARLGGTDVLARYGGEEFLLISTCPLEDTEMLLGRLREDTPHGQSFSAGLTSWDRTESPSDLVARADAALYRAKDGGRARTVADPVMTGVS